MTAQTLEAQHAQLLERCLAAEDTASKVPALQARVSEYKASLTQSVRGHTAVTL